MIDFDDLVIPEGYRPKEDEEYMSDLQLAYFQRSLLSWKQQLLQESEQTLSRLKEEAFQHADVVDRGVAEADRAFELRTRDRYRKLIRKIDKALDRIEEGSYGFCEETGDPIGLRRLEARPIATLCVKAQEAHERQEKLMKSIRVSA
ncbi:MAG: RNA polymerase-binding protein DksA [Desulfatibacillaceae bacterium]